MDILSKIQFELVAGKNQRNDFGKYNYRSCEDILEGLKPLLSKYECSIVLSDSIEMIGNRIYVKATAILKQTFITSDQVADTNKSTGIVTCSNGIIKPITIILGESTAFAREPESQKGMNEAQITGSASSYARKYALNGLFAIDDSKDADTNEHQNNANNRPHKKETVKPVDHKAQVTEVTTNTVRSYLTDERFAQSLELQDMKKALNDKTLLANQYLVDELIKEYGSLNA